MEYKRLTKQYPDGHKEIVGIKNDWCNRFDNTSTVTREALDRLFELEDKIESGELIFSKDCSKCKYENNFVTQYPCSHCCYCYTGKFEPKGAGNE